VFNESALSDDCIDVLLTTSADLLLFVFNESALSDDCIDVLLTTSADLLLFVFNKSALSDDCIGVLLTTSADLLLFLFNRNALYNNVAAKECIDLFATHAIRPMLMLFQITGHNRARQRDKWARLLEELALLHEEVILLFIYCKYTAVCVQETNLIISR